jgi:hypothetical protein
MSAFDELSGPDQHLAQRLQSSLHSGENLDGVTAAQLRAARARAVATVRPRSHGWWLTSGGLTAAVLIAVALVVGLPRGTSPGVGEAGTDAQAEVFEVLTDDVETDFYEDLDLYRWLGRTEDGAA